MPDGAPTGVPRIPKKPLLTHTTAVYSDGHRVPFYSYKCKSDVVRTRKDKSGANQHTCKIHIDHDGSHVCICGEKWDRKEKASNGN